MARENAGALIPEKYLPAFSQFFNRSSIGELLNSKVPSHIHSSLLYAGLMDQVAGLTYSELFESVYSVLRQNYACEYVYKNELLLRELIISRHQHALATLSEVAVGESKLDFLVVNGTTTAYEIKTEIDSLVKLEKQLTDYTAVFDKVVVLTHSSKVDAVMAIIDSQAFERVGVMTFSSTYELVEHKASLGNLDRIDPLALFRALTQSEAKMITGMKTIQEAREEFARVSPRHAHDILRKVLLDRAASFDLPAQVPPALAMAVHRLQPLSRKHSQRLLSRLSETVYPSGVEACISRT